ncbi:MAG: AsnC family transcriptional regulator [Syntrophobacteria bacterium]
MNGENENGPVLDEMDRAIINEIQSNFPIETRPYLVLAQKFGCSEEEVMRRVQDLKDRMIIRRIGANFNSRKLGYTSTLCAAQVWPDKLEQFIEGVNRYPGVTHNYRRDHDYNVWFTIIAASGKEIERIVQELSGLPGVSEIVSFPAERIFKIQVDFEI